MSTVAPVTSEFVRAYAEFNRRVWASTRLAEEGMRLYRPRPAAVRALGAGVRHSIPRTFDKILWEKLQPMDGIAPAVLRVDHTGTVVQHPDLAADPTLDAHRDHIWPWAEGGPDTAENLILVNACTNQSKRDTPEFVHVLNPETVNRLRAYTRITSAAGHDGRHHRYCEADIKRFAVLRKYGHKMHTHVPITSARALRELDSFAGLAVERLASLYGIDYVPAVVADIDKALRREIADGKLERVRELVAAGADLFRPLVPPADYAKAVSASPDILELVWFEPSLRYNADFLKPVAQPHPVQSRAHSNESQSSISTVRSTYPRRNSLPRYSMNRLWSSTSSLGAETDVTGDREVELSAVSANASIGSISESPRHIPATTVAAVDLISEIRTVYEGLSDTDRKDRSMFRTTAQRILAAAKAVHPGLVVSGNEYSVDAALKKLTRRQKEVMLGTGSSYTPEATAHLAHALDLLRETLKVKSQLSREVRPSSMSRRSSC